MNFADNVSTSSENIPEEVLERIPKLKGLHKYKIVLADLQKGKKINKIFKDNDNIKIVTKQAGTKMLLYAFIYKKHKKSREKSGKKHKASLEATADGEKSDQKMEDESNKNGEVEDGKQEESKDEEMNEKKDEKFESRFHSEDIL